LSLMGWVSLRANALRLAQASGRPWPLICRQVQDRSHTAFPDSGDSSILVSYLEYQRLTRESTSVLEGFHRIFTSRGRSGSYGGVVLRYPHNHLGAIRRGLSPPSGVPAMDNKAKPHISVGKATGTVCHGITVLYWRSCGGR